MKEHRIIHDKHALDAFALERYGVRVDLKPAGSKLYPDGCRLESSAAPLIWITNRIIEKGGFKAGCPIEADDFHCLETEGGMLVLAPVARSKVFRTNLLPEPIDLTAARVSVCTYSEDW